MTNYAKSWNVRFSSVILAVALVGCTPKNLPPVTPVTAQELIRATHGTGAKVVLVNLWASWCGPCREEFPNLVKLQRVYEPRGLKVIFVSWDDTPQIAARFLAKQGVTSPAFIKADSQNDQDFINGIEPRLTGAIPATLLYDGTGTLRDFWEGAASYERFEQKVQSIIGGKT
jgi:thiol-disulfide isomerase/thioredoxin